MAITVLGIDLGKNSCSVWVWPSDLAPAADRDGDVRLAGTACQRGAPDQ